MKIAALIIGIDGWDKYTKPLIDSIKEHQPNCKIVVVDNQSEKLYPKLDDENIFITRIQRSCYSYAINWAKDYADKLYGKSDWYVVLSNDVLCTGKFSHYLEYGNNTWVIGPKLMTNQGWTYLEGWCVAISSFVWDSLNGWDENFKVSSWEDVDFSTSAVEKGFILQHRSTFPFTHLDQKQRFTLIPDYWSSEYHNYGYFIRKHSPK